MIHSKPYWQRHHIAIQIAGGLLLALLALVGVAADSVQAGSARLRAESADASLSFPITGTQWTLPDPAYRVIVEDDGIFQLTYADLSAAGLPVDTLDPRTLRLFYMGHEIPIQVDGEGDGRFDSGDLLLFYGRSIDSLFYAKVLPDNKYSGENVYWLTYGGANGLRMASIDGSGSGAVAGPFLYKQHLETNFWYFTDRPFHPGALMPDRFEPGADRWLWTWFKASGSTPGRRNPYERNFTFFAQNLPASAGDGQIVAKFQGNYGKSRISEPDDQHHIRLYVNDNQVYDDPNAGHDFEQFTITATVPHTAFINGFNTTRVALWNTDGNIYDEVYLNWMDVSYRDKLVAENDRLSFDGEAGSGPWRYQVTGFNNEDVRVYDVTDLLAPQRVANTTMAGTGPVAVTFGAAAGNRRYVAVSTNGRLSPTRIEAVVAQTSPYTPVDLLDSNNGADWIVITHGDFWQEALRLATYRADQYRVALVDVQAIYDQFNGGVRSSESIREFLRYAYQNWSGAAPQFVLLMGDGNNDMRHYRYSEPTYIPPFLTVADPTLGETAADNRYVTLVGGDILPDMSIGRLPVSSPAQAAAVVDKTISYETTPFYNDWNTNVILISDDLEGGGGDFYSSADTLADGYADPSHSPESKFLPDPYKPVKIYLGQTCDTANQEPATGCQQDIIDAVNNGALFTSYVGHAVKTAWAVEELVNSSVVDQFSNSDRLSIFLAMACFEGFFHEADGTVPLAEQYILKPDGGAVASWSPTGFGVATGHDWLEQGLFLAVFQDKIPVLGKAMDAGKYYLHNNAPAHKYDDLIDTFLLFGDPALHIQTWMEPTAVDMAGLSAQRQGDGVLVTWQTGSEVDILGFNVLRSDRPDGEFVQVNSDPIWANNPGASQGFAYRYSDNAAAGKATHWYKLKVLKLDGSSQEYGLVASAARLFLPVVSN